MDFYGSRHAMDHMRETLRTPSPPHVRLPLRDSKESCQDVEDDITPRSNLIGACADPSTPRERKLLMKLVFVQEERGLPYLNRGWRTPDPSPRVALPKCGAFREIVVATSAEQPGSFQLPLVPQTEAGECLGMRYEQRSVSPKGASTEGRSCPLAPPSLTQAHSNSCNDDVPETVCQPCKLTLWADVEDSGSDEDHVVVVSVGSAGHPDSCAEACKYARKPRGCKDGASCDHCHFCTWKPIKKKRPFRARADTRQ